MASSSPSMRARREAVIFAIVVLFGILTPHAAVASQRVKLKASFSPDRLGVSTTINFEFNISSTTGAVPSPVTQVDVSLPAGMGLGTTNLGEETCNPTALFTFGPQGCSPNSRMGLGSATVELPIGPEPEELSAGITVYMGVPQKQHTTILIYAETHTPVYGQFVFPSELLPTSGAYGAELNTAMPLIPTWPDGPPAVIVRMETTLGPSHLTYYTHRHGKLTAYSPEGMAVPEHCPRGGFPFRATYRFADGSTTSATTSVPCPRHTAPKEKRRRVGRTRTGIRHRH
jgi:hypothetical protein